MPEPELKEEGKEEPEGKKEEELTPAQTKQALRYILQEVKSHGKMMSALEEKMNTHATPPKDNDSDDSRGDPKGEEVDIDALDNQGLIKHMTSQISEMLKPIQSQLTHSNSKIEETRASTEVEKAVQTYKDFFEFKDEIEEKIKKNPALSVDDAYHLAKVSNPDKVEALNKAAEEEKAKEEKPEEKSAFGGLLPTSTIGEPHQGMDAKEAASSAWEEHMAGFSALLSN